MNTYRGWQCNPKQSLPDNISLALQNHIDKFGIPAEILEVSDQLEKVELPEGLNLVTNVVKMPKNIILVGRVD